MKRSFGVLMSLVVTLGLLGSLVGTVTAAPGSSRLRTGVSAISTAEYSPDSEECAFLSIINTYRAQNGRGPLTLDRYLGAAAEHHSWDMATYNYWHSDHSLYDGTSWIQNLKIHGYDYQQLSTSIAENIAAGYEGASSTFTQWKNSSGHNANMLSGTMKAIGIGRAYNANATYKWYWTTTFGGKVVDPVDCSGSGGSTSPTPTAVPSPSPTPSPTSAASGTTLTIVRSARSTSASTSSAYAYDRKLSTNWRTTSSTPPSAAYIWFDLGSVKNISSISWYFGQSYTGTYDSQISTTSTSSSSWTTIATRSKSPSGQWITLDWSGKARYVRIYFRKPSSGKYYPYLAEVKITG
jgi:uncharacterized protein YkwD